MVEYLLQKLRSLGREESGQSLLFGALTLLLVVGGTLMVQSIATVTSRRIQIQTAADAAVIAGAQIESDAVSAVAWLNQGMATSYYNMMRYVIDVNTYGALARFVQHGEGVDAITTAEINRDADGAHYGSMSPDEVVNRYAEAWTRASEWVPRLQDWLTKLSKVARGLAIITPTLVEMEVYRVAKSNGAGATAIFPKFEMFPRDTDNFDLFLRRITGAEMGWDMVGSNGMHLKAVSIGQESWDIVYNFAGHGDNEVAIQYLGGVEQGPAYPAYHISATGPDIDPTEDYIAVFDPRGVTIINPSGQQVQITHNPDGSTTIVDGGHTTTIQVTGGGLQVNDGSGWHSAGGQETTNINGADVTVSNDNTISLGNGYITMDPNNLWFGVTHVTLGFPIHVSTMIGPVDVEVKEDHATLNGLTTTNPDGRWHRYNDSDRLRHRLTETVPAEEWEYNLRRIGSYFTNENDSQQWGDGRFSVYQCVAKNGGASMDSLPPWPYHAEENPTGWFDTPWGQGRVREEDGKQLYHHTRTCWHDKDDHQKGFWVSRYRDLTNNRTFFQLNLCPICYQSTPHNGIPDLDQGLPPPALYAWDNIPPGYDISASSGIVWENGLRPPANVSAAWGDPSIPAYIVTAYGAGSPPGSENEPYGSVNLPPQLDHNNDGKTDVRFYANDAESPSLIVWAMARTGGAAPDPATAFQQAAVTGIEPPLVLTEDFFKYGLNVACWHEPDDSTVPFLFSKPDWGYLATASARLFFRHTNPVSGQQGIDSRPGDLDWLDQAYPDFVYDQSYSMENETPTRRRRQIYARVYRDNLYDPFWEARLVSTNEAIRSEDIDAHEDVDSGTNYLYKNLLRTQWKIDYYHVGTTWGNSNYTVEQMINNMRYDDQSGAVDLNDRGIEAITKH